MDRIAAVKTEIAAWLADLLPSSGTIVAAEVGVKQGHLATRWLERCPNLSLYLVDRWKPAPPESDYAKIGDPAANADEQQHSAWYAEALSRMWSFSASRTIVMRSESCAAAAALEFESVELDCVFLDADHSYAGRLADLQSWWPLVKMGGLIAGGLLHSSFGGWGARDALHHHLATLKRQHTDVITGPASTWAYFQEKKRQWPTCCS